MIERQILDGRPATVAYLDEDMNPMDKDGDWRLAKIIFDDGEHLWLTRPSPADEDESDDE